MSKPDDPQDNTNAPPARDRARELILARRNRFMAAALAGAGVVGTGCFETRSPGDTGGGDPSDRARIDAGAQPQTPDAPDAPPPGVCLSVVEEEEPTVCLQPPDDPNEDEWPDDADAGPDVCLTPV